MSNTTKDEAIVIKRYQNRKLYNTQESCYVTLEEIARLVQEGDNVIVIDNKTKRDITAATLAQILFENEKRENSLIPLETLKLIIRTKGAALREGAPATDANADNAWLKGEVNRFYGDQTPEVSSFLTVLTDGNEEQVSQLAGDVTRHPEVGQRLRRLHEEVRNLESRLGRLIATNEPVNNTTQPVSQF
jgi:polyhydroxyalkanoate synthesis repressor PhaR